MMRTKILTGILIFLSYLSFAQPGGRPNEIKKLIKVETERTALIFAVGADQKLYQLYLGEKLASDGDYKLLNLLNEAYIPAGTDNLFELASRMVHNDGNPSLELLFVDTSTATEVDVTTTAIILKDPKYPDEV